MDARRPAVSTRAVAAHRRRPLAGRRAAKRAGGHGRPGANHERWAGAEPEPLEVSQRRDLDRRIAALAIPALGTLAIEPLYVLVDTAIVGRLGTIPLGGLALATTVLTTLLWAFNFLSFGTTARVAFLTGRADAEGAAGVAAQGLWLCVAIRIPLAAFVALGGRALASGLGGHGATLAAATTYLRISALGMPAVLIALVGQGHLRGLSDTRTPLAVVLVANVLHVVLE